MDEYDGFFYSLKSSGFAYGALSSGAGAGSGYDGLTQYECYAGNGFGCTEKWNHCDTQSLEYSAFCMTHLFRWRD